jgi:hypothetical protein
MRRRRLVDPLCSHFPPKRSLVRSQYRPRNRRAPDQQVQGPFAHPEVLTDAVGGPFVNAARCPTGRSRRVCVGGLIYDNPSQAVLDVEPPTSRRHEPRNDGGSSSATRDERTPVEVKTAARHDRHPSIAIELPVPADRPGDDRGCSRSGANDLRACPDQRPGGPARPPRPATGKTKGSRGNRGRLQCADQRGPARDRASSTQSEDCLGHCGCIRSQVLVVVRCDLVADPPVPPHLRRARTGEAGQPELQLVYSLTREYTI